MLFSEPKIPQSRRSCACASPTQRFSALQRAENSSIARFLLPARPDSGFSALQRAENSSIRRKGLRICFEESVSVLFSEPKIPQADLDNRADVGFLFQCSSASRKFLKTGDLIRRARDAMFQCSSASRKFLNSKAPNRVYGQYRFQCSSASRKFLKLKSSGCWQRDTGFSALQRAENSSIQHVHYQHHTAQLFQCSSASRKFLKERCSNPSVRTKTFQCSSASRKFLKRIYSYTLEEYITVSVLFSEPKIPQYSAQVLWYDPLLRFSALQRAENSSSCGFRAA